MANPGPASVNTVNTQTARSTSMFFQTIAVSMTPAAAATVTAAEQTFQNLGTGMLPGDVIFSISPPSTTAGVTPAGWRVDTTTADKFYVTWVNPTGGSLTPPSGLYLITIGRFQNSISTTPYTFSTLPNTVTAN